MKVCHNFCQDYSHESFLGDFTTLCPNKSIGIYKCTTSVRKALEYNQIYVFFSKKKKIPFFFFPFPLPFFWLWFSVLLGCKVSRYLKTQLVSYLKKTSLFCSSSFLLFSTHAYSTNTLVYHQVLGFKKSQRKTLEPLQESLLKKGKNAKSLKLKLNKKVQNASVCNFNVDQ